MFSPKSVSQLTRLFKNCFLKFYGMVGQSRDLVTQYLITKVKVTRDQEVQVSFANNSVQKYHRGLPQKSQAAP